MGSIDPVASAKSTMKAVVWEGHPYHVKVKDVPRPVIEHSTDAIIKVTTAAICGSLIVLRDLHVYHGLIGSTDPSWNLGHEAVGVVFEVGADVRKVKVGQRVLVPDGIPYDPNENPPVDTFGLGNFVGTNYIGGNQAEYIRLPLADQYAYPLPGGFENDNEYVLVPDIFPTSWEGITKSGFQAGDTVACFGCGPVGLMGQYGALLRGASKVYAIDHVPSRLAKAKSIGCIPIDIRDGDPATQILKLEPNGVNRSIDFCGFECVNSKLEKQENYILNQAVEVTTEYGGISIIGVYIGAEPSPGSPRQHPSLGYINFNIGKFFTKGLSMNAALVTDEPLIPTLMGLIESGRAKPSFVIDREITIDEAPQAYKDFSEHKYGKTLIKFPLPEST